MSVPGTAGKPEGEDPVAPSNGRTEALSRRLDAFSHRGAVPPRIARRALQGLLGRLVGGTLEVHERGRTWTYGDGRGIEASLEVRDPAAWSMVLQRGSVGLGESYVDGLIDSDDLVAALRLLTRNVLRLNGTANRVAPLRSALARPLDVLWRASRARDRENVRAHYDLGNEFFELFLDDSMTYSCAIFEPPGASLEEAQLAKLERLCTKLDLRPDDHVVEIGTGWGSFALHAASTRACRVTTTTISTQQYDLARRRVALAGLEDRIKVLNVDYRELRGSYTKLVSIEMIEAVDWRDHATYFSAIDRLLVPGGRAAIQAIVIGDEDFERTKRRQDFLKTYIFPGGCLPSVGAIATSLRAASTLEIADVDDIGVHYVPTLREWRRRLEEQALEAGRLGYDERFLRLWRFYLGYCEAAFLEGHVSDVQLLLLPRSDDGSVESGHPRPIQIDVGADQ